MSAPSGVTLSCKGHARGCCHERSRYRASVMFLEPTTSGTDLALSTYIGLVGNSHATTPITIASFAYVSIISVMPSRRNSVHSIKAESASRFNVPSQTINEIIRKQNRLRHNLIWTKIKLRTIEQNKASFDIQNYVFVKHVNFLNSVMRGIEAKWDFLRTIVEQQFCVRFSDRERRKGLYTVATVSLPYLSVATELLSELSARVSEESSEL